MNFNKKANSNILAVLVIVMLSAFGCAGMQTGGWSEDIPTENQNEEWENYYTYRLEGILINITTEYGSTREVRKMWVVCFDLQSKKIVDMTVLILPTEDGGSKMILKSLERDAETEHLIHKLTILSNMNALPDDVQDAIRTSITIINP